MYTLVWDRQFPFLKVQKMNIEGMERVMVADNSLMAETKTEEDAREIAEQYGIEFVSFENGIALYHTEEDPFEVNCQRTGEWLSTAVGQLYQNWNDTDGVQ